MHQEFKINAINILKGKTENGCNMKEKQEYKVLSRSSMELKLTE